MLAYPARINMKLPLQQNNVMVDELAVAGNDTSVWNDKTSAQIKFLRDLEHDKIQSFLS